MKRLLSTRTAAPLTLLPAALLFLPQAALAHPGHGAATGAGAGFLHPLMGADHVLAMVAVGLLAARLGGRALWLVPVSFVTMMILGGVASVSGLGLPLVELGIAGSILVLGFVLALGRRLPTPLAMTVAFLPFSTAMRMAQKCRWTRRPSSMEQASCCRPSSCMRQVWR